MVRFGYSPPKGGSKKTPSFESPVEEFHSLVDQLERAIDEARKEHVHALLAPKPPKTSPRGARLRSFFARRGDNQKNQAQDKLPRPTTSGDNDENTSDSPVERPQPLSPSASLSPTSISRTHQSQSVSFISSFPVDTLVETLRRLAELVVTGENYATSLEKKERAKFERFRDKWKSRDVLDDLQTAEDSEDEEEDLEAIRNDPKTKEYMQLFDLFFERQVLDTMISLLTGAAFRIKPEETSERNSFVHSNANIANVLSEDGETSSDENDKEVGDTPASPETNEQLQQETIRIVGDTDEETAGEDAPSRDHDTVDRDNESSAEASVEDDNASREKMDAEVTISTVPSDISTRMADAHHHRRTDSQFEAEEHLRLPPIDIAKQGLQSVSILIQNVSRATSLFIILSNDRINELISMPLDAYSMALSRELGCEASSESNPEMAELTTHFITFLKSLALRMNAQTLQFFLKYHSSPYSETGVESVSPSDGKSQPPRVGFLLYERALEFYAVNQESFIRTTALNICMNTLRLASVAPTDGDESSDDVVIDTKSPSGVLHDTKPLPFRERFAIALFTCIPSRVERLVSPICTKLAERWAAIDEQVREIDLQCQKYEATQPKTELDREKDRARLERMVRVLKQRAADLLDELHLLNDVFSVGLTVLNEQLIEMLFATFVYPLLLQPLRIFSQRLAIMHSDGEIEVLNDPFGGHATFRSTPESDLLKVAGPAKTALISLGSLFFTINNRQFLKLVYTALLHPMAPDTSALPTLRSQLVVSEIEGGKEVIRLDASIGDKSKARSTYAFGRKCLPEDIQQQPAKFRSDHCRDATVFVLAPALAEVLEYRSQDSCKPTTSSNPYRKALIKLLFVPDGMDEVRKMALFVIDAALSVIDGDLVSETLLCEQRADFVGINDLANQAGHQQADLINFLARTVVAAQKVEQSINEWRLIYNEAAAHALLSCCRGNMAAAKAAHNALEHLTNQAVALISSFPYECWSPMGGSELRMSGAPSVNSPDYETMIANAMKNFVFFESMDCADKRPVARRFVLLVDDRESSRDEIGLYLPIAFKGNFDSLCASVGSALSAEVFKNDISEREEIQLARDGMEALLQMSALMNSLRVLTNGHELDGSTLAGIAMCPDGHLIRLKTENEIIANRVYGSLSGFIQALFREDKIEMGLAEGATITLNEAPYLPCVCEVAAAFSGLFKAGSEGIVAEGVTWQSLYLSFVDGYMIVVQPRPSETEHAQGIIVSISRLDRLSVYADSAQPENGSLARRLLISHSWYEKTPPTLFLFDALPEYQMHGAFAKSEPFISTFDIWFEDQNAADLALNLISTQIFVAKARRGERVSTGLLGAL